MLYVSCSISVVSHSLEKYYFTAWFSLDLRLLLTLLTLDYSFATQFIFHTVEIEPNKFQSANIKEEDTVTPNTYER